MRRILFISTNDHVPWGGSEVLWSRAARVLASRGNAVAASLRSWETLSPAVSKLETDGVALHLRKRVPIEQGRILKTLRMARHGFVQQYHDNELEAIARHAPDLAVISLGNHLDRKFLRFASELQRRSIPYVVIVQLVHPYAAVSDEQADRLIAAYAAARSVVFVSGQNRSIACTHLGHDFPNACIIPNPVDLDHAPAPVPFPNAEHPFSLAMVAALTPFHKGQDIVLEVLARQKWRDRPLRVELYGEGGGRRILERNIAAHGLEQVFLRGFEADKQRIWSRNHMALFTSRMEGLSLALLEAMACGRAVISTRVGGAEERIVHGSTGYLVPYPDADALDQVLEEAWGARDQWQAMGDAAFAAYREATPVAPVEMLVELLES
jgi:glycosyltransferase involved in cell wall biosynthesis